MRAGTKSLLWGEHHFFFHPLVVAAAWWKLFGFPWDPRLWVCFFVHDLGYWGKPNMDGPEGKTHPELGAQIVHWLFDRKGPTDTVWEAIYPREWYDFCIYHSRSYAHQDHHPVSKLALADKLAFNFVPAWLFLPIARLSGCLSEYLQVSATKHNEPIQDAKVWHQRAAAGNYRWVYNTLKRPSPMPGYYRP